LWVFNDRLRLSWDSVRSVPAGLDSLGKGDGECGLAEWFREGPASELESTLYRPLDRVAELLKPDEMGGAKSSC
jgi:hypothetical protein